MWFGIGIIRLITWIAIAFWPARVAGRKGHSFIGHFILSRFFFPLAPIRAYVVPEQEPLIIAATPGGPMRMARDLPADIQATWDEQVQKPTDRDEAGWLGGGWRFSSLRGAARTNASGVRC